MRTALPAAVLTLSCLLPAVASAASFALVPQVGTAGYGATVQWGFSEYLAVSAGYTAMDRGVSDVRTDEARYSGDIRLRNPQVFLNWAPFGGHFRVSVGAVAQNSSFDLTARDVQEPGVTSVDVSADYGDKLAPAVTIGWETPLGKSGLGYHISLGAMYTGKPDVSVRANCSLGSCFGFADAEERRIKGEIEKYEFLPIAQAGVILRM